MKEHTAPTNIANATQTDKKLPDKEEANNCLSTNKGFEILHTMCVSPLSPSFVPLHDDLMSAIL